MLRNKIQLSKFELALQHFRQSELAEAQRYTLQQLQDTPNHTDSIKLLCVIHVRKQDYNEAANLINRLHELTQFDDELNNLAGSIYVELNDYNKATFYLKQILNNNANNVSATYNLGLLHYNNKEYQQAIPLLSNFLEKNINHETVLTILADCYLQLNELASALTYYQKIQLLNPHSIKAALGLLTIYVKQNQSDEIDNLLSTYTANARKNSNILFALGNYLLSCHYYQHSENIYQQLLPIMENNPQLLTHLAITYDALDDTSNAIKYLEQAIGVDPNCVDAYSVLGNIYTNLKQSSPAKKYLDQALTIDNCHVGANINMGRLKSYENNFDESDSFIVEREFPVPIGCALLDEDMKTPDS